MKIYGNYCGSNWSAGVAQPSVVSDVPAVDEFDDTCREHDAVYANGGDLLAADYNFAYANIGRGALRTAAGIAVGAQASVRALDKFIPKIYPNKTTMTRLRGSVPQVTKSSGPTNGAKLSTVPAAYGFSLKMQAPRIVRRGNAATIKGSDFASSVKVFNSSSYEPAASVLVNPTYFNNAMLGSMARTYEKFRVIRCSLQYVPAVPTSTQGQLVMCSTSTVKEPFLPGSASTFLSRALSQGNAIATPLWKEAVIDWENQNKSEWFVVDPLIDGDLDDCIAQEFQCYATCDTTATAGILIFHYELEFKDPLYTYHPTLIPNPVGNGTFISCVDDSAVNATSDCIVLVPGAPIAGNYSAGAVFRLVFQQAGSTKPTGPASWAAVARTTGSVIAGTGGSTTSTTNITMVTGTTLYAAVSTSTTIVLFASLEDATAGSLNGSLTYQTVTSAIGTWLFIADMVRLDSASRVTTQ